MRYGQLRASQFRGHRAGTLPADCWYEVLRDKGLKMEVALDVGANLGYTATWFSAWAAQVYAFEPDPENRAAIHEQFRIRHVHNVEVIGSAVAAEEGSTTLFLKPKAGHHSLADIGASETIDSIEVTVTTLDRFCAARGIERVGLLKIDVEGFEPDVLEGAGALLEKHAIDLILFEHSPAFYRQRGLDPRAPIDVLSRFGYRTTHLDGSAVDRDTIGDSPQTDLLAQPRTVAP
jgi:FkbM family methyltransferase